MNITELLQKIQQYQIGDASRSWTKISKGIFFRNEYLDLKGIASSNKWLGKPHESEIEKMWSIVIDIKKDFCSLLHYRELSKVMKVNLTPVKKGEFRGYWGIRIYKMKQEPTIDIIYDILNYIFQE